MKIERVQRWILSAVILSTAAHLVVALLFLAVTRPNPAALPVLTFIATVMAIISIVGTRVLNQLPILTPWLLAGLIPIPVAIWLA